MTFSDQIPGAWGTDTLRGSQDFTRRDDSPYIWRRRPCSRGRPTALLALESVRDRARRFETPQHLFAPRAAHDRARRFETHRTPCTYSAHDRAYRAAPPHPWKRCAASRADKRCTPHCTDTSPRARIPFVRGALFPSSPASSTPLPSVSSTSPFSSRVISFNRQIVVGFVVIPLNALGTRSTSSTNSARVLTQGKLAFPRTAVS